MSLEELFDILLKENASDILRIKEQELFALIPELRTCKYFNQNSDWHIYDVYEHILYVIDNVPANLVMRLTALFHDIGKPNVYTEDENGVGHFRGHWVKSKEIFSKFAKEHNLNEEISNMVSNLIYYHDINIAKLNNEEIEELYRVFGYDGIELLFQFKKADLLAQKEKYHYLLEDYDKQKIFVISKFKGVNPNK